MAAKKLNSSTGYDIPHSDLHQAKKLNFYGEKSVTKLNFYGEKRAKRNFYGEKKGSNIFMSKKRVQIFIFVKYKIQIFVKNFEIFSGFSIVSLPTRRTAKRPTALSSLKNNFLTHFCIFYK